MPLYDYACEACGHRFEYFKRLADREQRVECPECEQRAERLLSAFAVGGQARKRATPSPAPGFGGGYTGG